MRRTTRPGTRLHDRNGRGDITRDIAGAPPALQRLVAAAAERVLVRNATRTRSWLAAGDPAMASVTAAELRHVGEHLLAGLTS